ncbi:MAG: ribosomal protein S18-alanine N-acetyltransferase [Bacillota bacterium]
MLVNKPVIVRASVHHIDDIVTIEKLCFKIPWSRKSIEDEIIRNKSAIYFCAVDNGRTLGYCGMWQVIDEGYITNIAVHPEFRNCGIGSLLMDALLKEAEAKGIKALTLEVRKSNLTAQALYRKYGFESGGIRKRYYADNNEDAIIMWKRLAPDGDRGTEA